MSKTPRRLAAIMFTDIVGYTAVTQSDEPLAMKLLDQYRKLIRPIFPKHSGREVKTIGDGFLVEFASALEATECAVEMQKTLHEYNESSKETVLVRIGIHVGDVIHRNGDVYGDAVNIASRIEPLASGGGICISEQVYDQVRNKIPYKPIKLHPKELKNVAFPIDVYKLELPWEAGKKQDTEYDKRRLAILPFANISADPNDEYFADGMTEELISTTSSITGLTVIARTSVMRYKGLAKGIDEIGRELAVGTVLEGSVRKSGSRLRITVQLVDVQSQGHVWAQSYDRNLDDAFAVQTEIAKQVSEALRLKMLPHKSGQSRKTPTKNTEAHMLYLKGRFHWNTRSNEGINKAIGFFEEAVAKDPQYALAYGGLADCYIMLGVYCYRKPSTVFPKARELAAKALTIDKNLAEAHASMFEILAHYDFDWPKATSEIEEALELNPSYAIARHWYGYCYLASHGRFDEALKEIRRAEELDPLSMIIATDIGDVLYFAGQNDAAIEHYLKSLEIDPSFVVAHRGLARAYARMSKFNEALAEAKKAIDLSQRSVLTLGDLGYVNAVSGRRDEAMKILEEFQKLSTETYVPAHVYATVWAGLGDDNRAIEWLQRAYEERTSLLTWLKVDPVFEALKDEPRFTAILKKLGLD